MVKLYTNRGQSPEVCANSIHPIVSKVHIVFHKAIRIYMGGLTLRGQLSHMCVLQSPRLYLN